MTRRNCFSACHESVLMGIRVEEAVRAQRRVGGCIRSDGRMIPCCFSTSCCLGGSGSVIALPSNFGRREVHVCGKSPDLMVNRVTRYTLFVACMFTFCATHSEVASAQDTPVSPARSPLEAPALNSLELPGWLDLSGELRFRSENRYGLGFQEGSNDGYGLVRTRINVGVRPNEYVRLFFQGQDSRAPGIRPASATGLALFHSKLRAGSRSRFWTLSRERCSGSAAAAARSLRRCALRRLAVTACRIAAGSTGRPWRSRRVPHPAWPIIP